MKDVDQNYDTPQLYDYSDETNLTSNNVPLSLTTGTTMVCSGREEEEISDATTNDF